MDGSRILFVVSAKAPGLPSVNIRARQVAGALGAGLAQEDALTEGALRGRDVFILVKAHRADRAALRQRGRVLWDVVDRYPPAADIDVCLTSTRHAADCVRRRLGDAIRVYAVPHHHMVLDAADRPALEPDPANVFWIGDRHWYPGHSEIPHEYVDVRGMDYRAVYDHFCRAGILLNTRRQVDDTARHLELNSGIKLINCLGFGVPSVSTDEPAYREIAPDCTVFAPLEGVADTVRTLQYDRARWREMRQRCLALAPPYSLAAIAQRYREVIEGL